MIVPPTKTAISLDAMSNLQGTIPCFITLTLVKPNTNSKHKTDL